MSIKEKIFASIYLSSYLDTLGFNNGHWELNFNKVINNVKEAAYINMEIMHQFFSFGGFSNINISKWKSSDDSIMMISTILASISGGKEENFIEQYLNDFDKLKDIERIPGNQTLNSLEFIRNKRSIDKLNYDSSAGGNGAAMRTGVIGILNHKEDDVEGIIEMAITASRVTHNYYLGFLSGLNVALFANFGMRNIHFLDWFDEFFKLENKIDEYMKKTNIYKEYLNDKDKYFDFLRGYKERRVNKFKFNPVEFTNFKDRIESLDEYNNYGRDINYSRFGMSGLSSVIVAYDSLLMSHRSDEYPFEKEKLKVSFDSFVFYSTLHFGDNDTTGAIAGIFYGSIYGYKNLDKSKFEQLEFYEVISKLLLTIEKKL